MARAEPEKKKAEIEAALKGASEKVSVIKLVDDIVEYAFDMRASDIHLDPAEQALAVRMRIDGILHKVFSVPKELHPEVIARIKVMADLRTDEHYAAQDGRILVKIGTNRFDIRVSIIPTFYGEDAVLRLLAEYGQTFTLKDIGFSERDLKIIERAVQKPYGMILATGPTGSGKTTTLYTILKLLNTEGVSIITIEDPIEYSLENVNQIQTNPETGLTFADGLRAILRQDPNIIMVGEIRDEETAGIAVNAALTGHLMLSTLHTNDAVTTLPRLIDMKVEPFLIASTVNIAIAQRLVRRICEECKAKKTLSPADLEYLAAIIPQNIFEQIKKKGVFAGKGCAACGDTGYHGRIGIHEVLEVTDAVREAIVRRASAAELQTIAIREGMTTMSEDGFRKVLLGITTIEEVLRVTRE